MSQKIIYFVDSRIFGGSEQALLHLLSRLDRQRWEPVLFHHGDAGIGQLVNGVQRLDIRTRIVPRMEGMNTIIALPLFIKYIRAERPVVFHAHLCWLLSCKYGLLATSLTRIRAVIATTHNFMYPPWRRGVYMQQQIVTRFVDLYIAVSHAIAHQLHQTFNVPVQKMRVIHNSIPIARYQCPANPTLRNELSNGRPQHVVLTVARLDRQKGHSYLFEAIRQVRDAIFILAGSGPEIVALKNKAAGLSIQDRVIFLGERDDVPELLASCDIFVLPSLYEGLPLSILEAMAAGKPVVATAVGGTPEVVMDGETGILVPPKDPTALAEAIQTLLVDRDQAIKMGQAGRARVEQEFSPDMCTQQVFQAYDEFLAK